MTDLSNDEEIALYLQIEAALATAGALKLGLADRLTDVAVAWINEREASRG